MQVPHGVPLGHGRSRICTQNMLDTVGKSKDVWVRTCWTGCEIDQMSHSNFSKHVSEKKLTAGAFDLSEAQIGFGPR